MAILDRAVRRVLDRMRIAVRPNATSGRQGGHRSPFKAAGVEFADHRPYVSGDDVRHIDWKAFARHGHLVMRQFEEERDAFVHVLLDVSGSMSRGKPAKIEVGARLAASFAYVGVRQFDRARVIPFADEIEDIPLALKGPQDLPRLERLLSETAPGGPTAFDVAVRQVAARGVPRGLVVVISDLMAPDGWDDGFRHLGAMGHELRVIRVGCSEDDDPQLNGELELQDTESDQRIRLRVGKKLLSRYKQIVREHHDAVRESVRRAGGRWIDLDVATPTDDMLKRVFAAPTMRSAAT